MNNTHLLMRRSTRALAICLPLLLAAAGSAAAQQQPEGKEVRVPDPDAGRPVSLRGILAWAGEHAPAVSTAESRVALGEAAREGARPLFRDNPLFQIQAGSKREGGQRGYQMRGWLLQPVEVAGERRQRIDAADRTHERLEVERDATRWRVHQRVHLAFHAALLARERAEVAGQVLEFQQELLSYAEQRLEAGDIGQLPVRLTRGETAEARQRKIAADQEYASARLRLAEVSGWPIASPPEPLGELDEARRAPPLDRLVALAERHHPALRTQRARIAETEAQVDLANRKAWPDPAIGIAYGREEVGNVTEQAVLGMLRIPFPVWRQNTTERARAEAQLGIARAERDEVRFNLRARLARAAAEVDAAAKRVEVYGQEVLPELEGNLQMLRRGFELGEFSILDVSVARERFLRIQTQAFDAYAAYFDAVAALETEVGTELWPRAHER